MCIMDKFCTLRNRYTNAYNTSMWSVKKSKPIFSNPRLSLVEDTVELTDGTQTDYVRFAGEPKSVAIIIKNTEGKILLLREYTWPNDTMIWNFPGGMVEEGETIKQAMDREAMEEAGCTIVNERKIGVMYPYHRRSKEQLHIFVADYGKEIEQQLEAEEEIEIVWKTESEISKLLREEPINNAHTLGMWAFYLLDPKHEA